MSFTNHTPNYNLPQYVGTDKPTFLGDFNNAMTTIDTQMHNNAQNAGEGITALQQAQAALSQTQETLTEVQTEVANVSGIAANVNTNVQQALSAANDATTAANNATSQIQPAVTAANKASADAQAAQQVANGNVTTLNNLSERVTALEESAVTEISGLIKSNSGTAYVTQGNSFYSDTLISAPSGYRISAYTLGKTNKTISGSSAAMRVATGDSSSQTNNNVKYSLSNPVNGARIEISGSDTVISIGFINTYGEQFNYNVDYTVEFEKVSA